MINVIQTLKNLNKEFKYQVTCDDKPFIYNTVTKNHAADKTSFHQSITSEGEHANNEDANFSSTMKDLEELQRILKATYGTNCPIEE